MGRYYASSDFTGKTWWALACRRYLLALERAARKRGDELRIIWRDREATVHPDLTELEFHPLLERMGGGGGGGLSPLTVYLGEVTGAADFVMIPDEHAERTVAVVTWPTDTLPPSLSGPMACYSAVIVPTERCRQTFLEAGLEADRVFALAPPNERQWWAGARPLFAAPRGTFVFYAIGTWGDLDNTRAVVAAYCAEFSRKDPVMLYVCSPDHPVRKVGDLARCMEVKDDLDLPRVALEPTVSCLTGTSVYWRTIHLSGHGYVSASRRLDLDPWELDAIAAGRAVTPSAAERAELAELVEASEADPELVLSGAVGELKSSQLRAAMRLMFDRAMRRAPASQRPAVGAPTLDAATVVCEAVYARAMASESTCSTGATAEASDRLAVVIPHKDRGMGYLQPCVDRLLPELRPGDHVIIVDQGSAPDLRRELEAFCFMRGLSLVDSDTGNGTWNLSRARNDGATLAGELGARLVWFLDCDILVAPGYVERARLEAGKGDRVIVPYVFERGTVSPRRATGLSMFQLDLLDAMNGYDTAYEGWGDEDVDFLWRLRERLGISAVLLSELAVSMGDHSLVLEHVPHPLQPRHEETARANAERFKRVAAGERFEVNPMGWRGGTVVLKGGGVRG